MQNSNTDKKSVPTYENTANTAESFNKILNAGKSRSSIKNTTPKMIRSCSFTVVDLIVYAQKKNISPSVQNTKREIRISPSSSYLNEENRDRKIMTKDIDARNI